MLILGLLLILGSGAMTVGLVYDGSQAASFEILGATVSTTMTGVFIAGAGSMLVFLIGVWLLISSMGRSRRKRGERKESRRRQHDSVTHLEEERTQLRVENERLSERLGNDESDTAPAATSADATSDDDTTNGDTPNGDTPNGDKTDGDAGTPGAHSRTDADLRQPEAAASQPADGIRG